MDVMLDDLCGCFQIGSPDDRSAKENVFFASGEVWGIGQELCRSGILTGSVELRGKGAAQGPITGIGN
jgi:hypothetical protein